MATTDRRCVTAPAAARRAGLSLLEIAVTIGILTSVTLGTSLILVPLARQSRINRETAVANAAARRILEKIRALPFRQIPTRYPDGVELRVSELPAGVLSVRYEDAAADPLEIHVQLTWESTDLGRVEAAFVTVRTE